MVNSAQEVSCPSCGAVFVPPAGRDRFFCPRCGRPIAGRQNASATAPSTSEDAPAQAVRAAEQAARAAEAAAQAARIAGQAEQRPMSVEEANRAVEQAMEAVRMAEEARRVAEQQSQRQSEELSRQREALERQQAERRAVEERQQAKAQAAGPSPASPSSASPAQQAQPRPHAVEYRRNVTVRHTDGRGLFTVTVPTDWLVQKTEIRQQATRHHNPYVKFTDGEGGSMVLRQGDVGTRLSSGMQAIMSTYGAAIAGVDTTNYASMPHPKALADDYVRRVAREVGATDVRLARELASPDLKQRQQQAYEAFREMGSVQGNLLIQDPFAAEVLRIYDFQINDARMSYAVYVRLYAVKDSSGVENMSPMGLMFNAGSALSGLFSGRQDRRRQAREAQRGSASPAAQSSWCVPDFDAYTQQGTIYWDVCGFATLAAPTDRFDELFNTAFLPLVRTYELHSDVVNLAYADARQEAMMVQQATNRQINAMNMQTQATLAAARQASAASTARTEDYLRQSDARHQAFRQRTNAQFDSGYGGGAAPDFSEAIRGVNTYVTTDGREVELDVSAERAYQNQAGDVIGGSGGFDPGADWTEIPRA